MVSIVARQKLEKVHWTKKRVSTQNHNHWRRVLQEVFKTQGSRGVDKTEGSRSLNSLWLSHRVVGANVDTPMVVHLN